MEGIFDDDAYALVIRGEKLKETQAKVPVLIRPDSMR